MNRKVRTLTALFILGGLLALAASQTTAADDTKKPADTSKEDAKRAADYSAAIARAYSLAEFGRKNKSPEAVLMAAGILKKLPKITTEPVKVEVEVEGEKGPEATKAKSFSEQAADMIDEALAMVIEENKETGEKILGKDSATVSRMADDVKNMAPASRTAIGGLKVIQRGMAVKAVEKFVIAHTAGAGRIAFRASGSLGIKVVRADRAVLVNDVAWSGGAIYNTGPKASNLTFILTNHHGAPLNYVLYIY